MLEVLLEKMDLLLNIRNFSPTRIVVDFEIAIINAVRQHFGGAIIQACLFHLCQSVFRHVQDVGMQRAYNNAEDKTIRDAVRRMCAIAFVPVNDVIRVFDMFKATAPRTPQFAQLVKYFEVRLH